MSKLTLEELKNKILNYDFKTNGMRAFAKENNIHHHTVSKYVKMLNVAHNSNVSGLERKKKPGNKHFDVHVMTEEVIEEPVVVEKKKNVRKKKQVTIKENNNKDYNEILARFSKYKL